MDRQDRRAQCSVVLTPLWSLYMPLPLTSRTIDRPDRRSEEDIYGWS
jgi:hypothetical protein